MIERMTEWTAGALDPVKPNGVKVIGAAIGAAAAWISGLPPIAQALLLVQGADVLTGVLCALTQRSPKTESGKLSSGVLTVGMVKKGLEWLVVLICMVVGGALELPGIGGAAMTYMIAAEMVSLMENLHVFGLDVPVLRRLLDAAQGEEKQDF